MGDEGGRVPRDFVDGRGVFVHANQAPTTIQDATQRGCSSIAKHQGFGHGYQIYVGNCWVRSVPDVKRYLSLNLTLAPSSIYLVSLYLVRVTSLFGMSI